MEITGASLAHRAVVKEIERTLVNELETLVIDSLSIIKMVILIELPSSDLIKPMDRVNYVLALDLPQTVKSAQPAAFVNMQRRSVWIQLPISELLKRYDAGLSLNYCSCITYHSCSFGHFEDRKAQWQPRLNGMIAESQHFRF